MIVIGEKINGTVEPVRKAIRERDTDAITAMAASQATCGAHYIDVNVGTGDGGQQYELESMAWALSAVTGATERPVALDSADPVVLEAALAQVGETRPFINSVTGEKERMEAVLPLAALYDCPIIALAMGEGGVPGTPGERLAVCGRILKRAVDLGIPEHNLYFDPLALPLSTDYREARITLETLSMIKREFPGVKSVIGLTNVSFGLPVRSLINSCMLSMCVHAGLDAVIMDPTVGRLRSALYASLAVAGHDAFCSDFIKAYRQGLVT